jgi:transcriptional regulator with XRE-family HTH domain
MFTNADVRHPMPARTLPPMVKKATPAASEIARQAGLRLRAAILALDLKVTQLANTLGVQQNTLSNWTSDKNGRMPDQIAMLRLWQHYRVPMEFIYGGETGRMEYDLREKIIAAAAQIGAVLGGPVAEWPMQADSPTSPRPPAAAPRRRAARVLHEDPKPFGQ